MHLGSSENPNSYKLSEELAPIEKTKSEKEVRVFIGDKLSSDSHITEKINKANSVLGAIRRSFEYLDKDTFKKLYTALVRSHLECAYAVWSPYKRQDMATIENILNGKSHRDTQRATASFT